MPDVAITYYEDVLTDALHGKDEAGSAVGRVGGRADGDEKGNREWKQCGGP